MKKSIILTIFCLISYNSYAVLINNKIIKSNDINEEFNSLSNSLLEKNIALNFYQFQSGENISKESFYTEFEKISLETNIPVPEISNSVILSSELNSIFSSLKTQIQSLPIGIINSINGRTYYDGSVAKSCYEYKNKNQKRYVFRGVDAISGEYLIQTDSSPAFKVYCDMESDGGGWTLIYTQQAGAYKRLLEKNNATVTLASSGSLTNLEKVAAVSKEFKWTDTSLNSVQHYSIYSSEFATEPDYLTTFINALKNQTCNTTNSTVWMRFSNGYLNTANKARKMEACKIAANEATYLGFRNNMNYSSFKDVINNSTTHECWRDENISDRIFAVHANPINAGACSQFPEFNWAGKGNGRGGSMNYHGWMR